MSSPTNTDLLSESRSEAENERFKERLLITFIALLVLSGFVLALRLYTKVRIVRNWGLEDACAICAYVCHKRLRSIFSLSSLCADLFASL